VKGLTLPIYSLIALGLLGGGALSWVGSSSNLRSRFFSVESREGKNALATAPYLVYT